MKYFIILVLINLFLCAEVHKISINEELEFDTSQKEFLLEYSKETDKASLFILFYEKSGNLEITLTIPDFEKPETTKIHDDNGYISFPFTKDGDYYISFGQISEEDTFKGKFKVITSERPFSLDINKEISFDYLEVDSESEPCPLIFSLENIPNDNFMKRIHIEEDEGERSRMLVSENGGDFKKVTGELMYFNKDSKYLIKLEFIEFDNGYYGDHYYFMRNFMISDFEFNLTLIEDFSVGTKFNRSLKYLFTKIDLKENDKFYVRTEDDLLFAYIDNEEQFNNFPNGIQYLEFNHTLENAKFEKFVKPKDKDYMIIFIEFGDEFDIVFYAKDVPMELNKETHFDVKNLLFKFDYEKKNNELALLSVFYEYKNNNKNYRIEIKVFNNEMESLEHQYMFDINKDTVNFIVEDSGEYYIFFTPIDTEGNFTVVSSEYEFEIDANKEIYFFNDFKEDLKFQSIFTFSISNIDKNYKKLFSSINDLEDIISYKKNKNEFMPMKKGLFLYEKGDSITIKIDIKKIALKDKIHISNIDESNILDLEFTNYEFPESINKIFKIDYLSSPYFKIEGDKTNRYYISHVDKTRYDAIDKCLGNLTFTMHNDNIYIRPVNLDYGILIVEIINQALDTNLTLTKLSPQTKELKFDSEETFNSFYSKYELEYEKGGDTKEILLFMYKMDQYSNNFEISINGPNNYVKKQSFDNKEKIGSYAFESGDSGKYEFSFKSEKGFEGTFKIVKASEPIKIDINDNIKLNTFNTTIEPKPITIEFSTKGLNDNTYKEFLIGDNNNLDLIKISSDNSENKNLTLNYYAFEKEKEYKIEIEYNALGNNLYKFEQFIMNTFKFDLIDFQKYGPQTYPNISTTQFIKIDLTKFSKIKIAVTADKAPIFKVAYYDDDLDMVKILNDLVFRDLKDNTISDESHKKAVLMIQLKPVQTKIDFTDANGNDGKKDDDDDNNTVFIVLGVIGGVLLLIIIIFLICRCRRKSAEPDISGGEDKREELMPQTD